jgi:hypothetical protein
MGVITLGISLIADVELREMTSEAIGEPCIKSNSW